MIALKAVLSVITAILYTAVVCKPELRASAPTPLAAGALALGSLGVQAALLRRESASWPRGPAWPSGAPPWVSVGEAENTEVI
jgi:hypothetical protein